MTFSSFLNARRIYLYAVGVLLSCFGASAAGGAGSLPNDDPVPRGLWTVRDGEALLSLVPAAVGFDVVLVSVAPPLHPDDEAPRQFDRNNPNPDHRGRALRGLVLGTVSWNADKGVGQGRLYDPESGQTFRVNLNRLASDLLQLRAYVGLPILGRTFYWVSLARYRTRMTTLWARGTGQ